MCIINNRGSVLNEPYTLHPSLLAAINKGHLDVVNVLLAAGAGGNAQDQKGRYALGLAVNGGHFEIVKALIAAGCKVNSSDKEGATALHKAARKSNLAIAEALVAAGADFSVVDKQGKSPLAWATGRDRAVQKFLDLGAPVDASALVAAAIGSYLKPLELLLAAPGADVTSIPAVAAAASGGQADRVKVLLSVGLSADTADDQGRTPLMVAAACNPGKAAEPLEVVKALVAAGASLNCRDSQGRTVLMYAARTPSKQALEIVQPLLAAGAGVDEKDSQGWTAIIHAAADSDHASGHGIIKALAAAGASIDAKDKWDRTALHALVTQKRELNAPAFRALVEAGADVNASDANGVTPLMAAIKSGNDYAAHLLIASGADKNAADNCGNTPAFMAAVGMGTVTANILQVSGAQGAPTEALAEMFRAAASGDVWRVVKLAAAPPPEGVDINAVGGAGVHCLHLLATHMSEREHWHERHAAEDLKRLRAAGANVAAASQTYPTPLDVMFFWHGLDWFRWANNAEAIALMTRELAAAGCPVDTGLPARVGDGSLQPSTLETWLDRLAQHGWPDSQDLADRALTVSKALLECAAAQGSRGRPELLAAAEVVGSPELVAAVQTVLPPQDPPVVLRATKDGKGRSRGISEDATRTSAVAAVPRHPPSRLLPAAIPWGMKPAWGGVARSRASWHVRYLAGSRQLARWAV